MQNLCDFDFRKSNITSFILQPINSAVDSLCSVVLNWADFNPLPSACKKFSVVLSTDAFQPNA